MGDGADAPHSIPDYTLVYNEDGVPHHRVVAYVTQFDGGIRAKLLNCAHRRWITHVNIGLFHLNYDSGPPKTRYISLNDDKIDNKIANGVLSTTAGTNLHALVKDLQAAGVKVLASFGGDGTKVKDFRNLFESVILRGQPLNFPATPVVGAENFYTDFLLSALKLYGFDGIDLDIEEPDVFNEDVVTLINALRDHLPADFLVSGAPMASALVDGRNQAKNLHEKNIVDQFDWYNLQFYNDGGYLDPPPNIPLSMDIRYPNVVENAGVQKASKLVACIVTNKDDLAIPGLPKDEARKKGYNDRKTNEDVLRSLATKYPYFGGVCGWTFQNAVSDNIDNVTPAGPESWMWGIWGATHFNATVWTSATSLYQDEAASTSRIRTDTNRLDFLMGDIDGDGRAELIQPWANGKYLGITVYRYVGPTAGLVRVWNSSNVDNHGPDMDIGQDPARRAFHLADVDGDGRLELIQVWANGQRLALTVYKYADDGTGFQTAIQKDDTGQGRDYVRMFPADIDGDGQAELIQFWNADAGLIGVIAHRFHNDITSITSDVLAKPFSQDGKSDIFAADLDGEGRMDLIDVSLLNNRISISTYNGVTNQGSLRTDDLVSSPEAGFLVADFDGDGKDEILQPQRAIQDNRPVLNINFYRRPSAGTGLVNSQVVDRLSYSPSVGFYAVDVDGDGRAELLRVWRDGTKLALMIYKYIAPDRFRIAWEKTFDENAAYLNCFAADVDGDGRAELIKLWDNGGFLGIDVYKFFGTL